MRRSCLISESGEDSEEFPTDSSRSPCNRASVVGTGYSGIGERDLMLHWNDSSFGQILAICLKECRDMPEFVSSRGRRRDLRLGSR